MSTSAAKVILFPGKEKSIQRFHQWIFSGAIDKIEGTATEGDVVQVYSATDQFLALGHIQTGAIAVRILSFEPVDIDQSFWAERLSQAFELRKETVLKQQNETNSFRLVHGEGDRLPGLVIDIYNQTAVFQAHSVGMFVSRKTIADALLKIDELALDAVYDKSSHTLNLGDFPDAEEDYLVEGTHSSSETTIRENGNEFFVNFLEGQKTGFFLDQRENRNLLGQFSENRTVLNLFAYSGGFSVYALKHGATHVDSVDSSETAIAMCNRNVELNFGMSASHAGICEDGFQFLKQDLRKYDLVILDPPAFAKHPKSVKNAHIGYKRLNQQAMKGMKSGSFLFTFSCSQAFSKDDFQKSLYSAARNAHRQIRIISQLGQPADHPVDIFHPESNYLKGFVLQVI